MKRSQWITIALSLLLSLSAVSGAFAQEYEPYVGQQGKDVIWVPTPDSLIQGMFDMAKVTSDDLLYDLGSGDGRIVIAAAKRGAHAVGIEFNPEMVALSKRNAEKEGVSDKATFLNADIFESDFSKATVVSLYLLPQLNLKLRPIILNMKPGTRVVSNTFTMGEWAAEKSFEAESRTAYFWIVPAKVEGIWTWQTRSGNAELKLTQSFQNINGMLKLNGKETSLTAIKDAKLQGDHISFSAGAQEFEGKVNGNAIEGTVKTNNVEEKWSAALSQKKQ
jgi:SAM-dependent methyltransferase